MKRKYSEAAQAKKRLHDAYINGLTDDEQAMEAIEWHDEHVPQYEVSAPDRRLDEQLPF